MANSMKNGRQIIALLTDFSWQNWYLGVMKGVILGINPAVRIVDLCHNVSTQDVREGSFVLGGSYHYFPDGTIFLCVVDPGVGGKRKNLVAKTDRHFFVAPDNGILSSIFDKGEVKEVYHVDPGKHTLPLKGATFFGRDIFAPIAAHLSLGVEPEEMGGEIESVLRVPALKPFVNSRGEVSGRAVYIDTFGNIITNIDEDFLTSVYGGTIPGKDCRVRLAGKEIRGLKRYYEQGEQGKLMALIDSWGLVEIAVNRGNAYEQLGLKEKKSLEIFLVSNTMTAKGED